MVKKALHFAKDAHQNQLRKFQDVPYVWHVVSVSKIVESFQPNSNENLRVAAILHDVVEDTSVSIGEIDSEFGSEISSLVAELTSDKEKQAELGKPLYLKTKMVGMSDEALFIKLCDRLDNVIDLKIVGDEDFVDRYKAETGDILMYLKQYRDLQRYHVNVVSRLEEMLSMI